VRSWSSAAAGLRVELDLAQLEFGQLIHHPDHLLKLQRQIRPDTDNRLPVRWLRRQGRQAEREFGERDWGRVDVVAPLTIDRDRDVPRRLVGPRLVTLGLDR
jgi:hypothetical protein